MRFPRAMLLLLLLQTSSAAVADDTPSNTANVPTTITWDSLNDGEKASLLNDKQDAERAQTVPVNAQPAGAPATAFAPSAPATVPAAPPQSTRPAAQTEQAPPTETASPSADVQRSIDDHLSNMEQQAQALAEQQEEAAERQAALEQAREDRIDGYNDALQSLGQVTHSLGFGTATDPADAITALQQSLQDLQANAAANAGQGETGPLNRAIESATRAENALAASDWLTAQYALTAAQISLQRAVTSANAAAPAAGSPY